MQSTGRRMAIDAEHWSAKSNVVSATPASLIATTDQPQHHHAPQPFFEGFWRRSNGTNGPWGAWESAAASVWPGSLSQHETQADAANGASFLF